MIRYTILGGFIVFFCAYSFKDWFKSLCALIFLMAVLERPDMPKQLLDIPGLNPWNLLMLFVLLGWFMQKRKEKLHSVLSPGLKTALITMALLVIVSFIRMIIDLDGFHDFTTELERSPISVRGQFIDSVINTIKWTIPGLLILSGCNTRERQDLLYFTIFATVSLLALQIIRTMGIGILADGSALEKRAVRVFDRDIGYHRNQISALMASSFWLFILLIPHMKTKLRKFILLNAAAMAFLSLMLTGSRSGYLAWAMVGVVLAWYKWRRYLMFGAAAVVFAVLTIPALQYRVFQGQSEEEIEAYENDNVQLDGNAREFAAMSSGRSVVWPFVLNKIADAPFFGHGREAMVRTGISLQVYRLYNDPSMIFRHPHSAYLQLFLDMGIIGAMIVLIFYFIVFTRSMNLMKHEDKELALIGSIGIAYFVAYLTACLTALSFYPNEGIVITWCIIGLILRYSSRRLNAPVRASLPA